ncbi:MAG: efflux RND transporter periplasmic adaptor subunit, partial [Tannerella sp.]|nr:efflux RND transporter periplasmic adaptor subunit [Tannerella sp.]
MNKHFLITGIFCLLLLSCRNGRPPGVDAGLTRRGDTVFVSGRSAVSSGIKLLVVETRSFSTEFYATGTVRPVAGQMAEIAPLFDGRVTRSFVALGQRVDVGTPLFELHSAEFSDAVKNYFQSLQAVKTTELNLRRQEDLVKNGVGVVRELEEAEAGYEVALKECESA